MTFDYKQADKVLELSFASAERPGASLTFPKPGTLSDAMAKLLGAHPDGTPVVPYQDRSLFASAGVEMWHRAIHSFLWSVALTTASPLWASVCGYYASHFIMRAYAHSLGFFKSFAKSEIVQVTMVGPNFVCSRLDVGSKQRGEHSFYWKVVKKYPDYLGNNLFRENSERDPSSESAHRTFANYTDHLSSFRGIDNFAIDKVAQQVDKISRIRRDSVVPPTREAFPDLQNVQIIAFQRIVEFQDFLDSRVGANRFWNAHRRPAWCRNQMIYQVEEQYIEVGDP